MLGRPIADPINPCIPSPCGSNSQCREINGQGVCSCLPNYIGSPPYCKPECIQSSDCPTNLACKNMKCQDPCPGLCGANAVCSVVYHQGICQCTPQYTGDPFSQCSPIPCKNILTKILKTNWQIHVFSVYIQPEIPTPCVPSPCGANAVCKERNGAGSCSCLPEYYGDPYNYCKPECIANTDCDRSRACFNQKCVDPCPGVCGNNAECHVVNHSPSCTCFPGYTGNPLSGCREPPKRKVLIDCLLNFHLNYKLSFRRISTTCRPLPSFTMRSI